MGDIASLWKKEREKIKEYSVTLPEKELGDLICNSLKQYGFDNIYRRKGNPGQPVEILLKVVGKPDIDPENMEENDFALYPFDLDWGAAVIVMTANNRQLVNNIQKGAKSPKENMEAFLIRYARFWCCQSEQIELGTSSDELLICMCMGVLFNIILGKQVKLFPDLYFLLGK